MGNRQSSSDWSMVDSLMTSFGIGTFRATAAAAKIVRDVGGKRGPREFQRGVPPTPRPDISTSEMESTLAGLEARKLAWAKTGNREKANLLEQCLDNMVQLTDECARKTVGVKGSYESGLGEELAAWSSCCWIVSEAVKSLRHDFKPPVGATRTGGGSDPCTVVETFPRGLLMNLVFFGMRGEVWLQPGEKIRQGPPTHLRTEGGSLWLVLGAGNQIPAVVSDLVHCLFMCNAAVVLKMNPINDFLGDLLERSFDPLIRNGSLSIVYGGADVGKALVNHPLTQVVHMTGSDKTFDAITWRGKKPKSTGAKAKDASQVKPPFAKPMHAELGCVTPYIILPGNWTEEDLDFQATQCVSGKVHNAGHNCVGLEVLVVPENWHLREKFVDRVKFHLQHSQKRMAWYPNSKGNFDRFLLKFPHAEQFGSFDEETGQAPWVMASGLSPSTASTRDEHWCGVIQEVRIKSKSLQDYVERAADFCNNQLWGDLSCAVFVDPKTQKHSKEELDYLISSLKYGSVAVNCPTTLIFAVPSLTWGAYPGNTLLDIQSGNTCVHNSACLKATQKSVLYAPWKPPFYPVWNYDTVNLENSARCMVKFFAYPSFGTFAALAMQALLGTP